MSIRRRPNRGRSPDTSWDDLADWYDGWAGAGSDHHRTLAIPALLELLALRPGERLLDIGCGPAPLAPHVARAGASYTGIDLSPRMVAHARARHAGAVHFLVADARDLAGSPGLRAGAFDAAVFLLSLQNIDPLEPALASAAWALRSGGRLMLRPRPICTLWQKRPRSNTFWAPPHTHHARPSWPPGGIQVLEHSALSRLASARRLHLLPCSGATPPPHRAATVWPNS
ncbi:MAG: class I SAM-dependent methyltransferase [Oscillochloris sp.]|nr:class I SAM-dependent methyltransferase [Oscillochloris sp.]